MSVPRPVFVVSQCRQVRTGLGQLPRERAGEPVAALG